MKAGFDWGDGGIVNKITPGGAASKVNLKPKMRLTKVNDKIVQLSFSKKIVEEMLVDAREVSIFHFIISIMKKYMFFFF